MNYVGKLFSIWVLIVAGVVWSPELFGWPFWKFPALLAGTLLVVIATLFIRGVIRFRRQGWGVWATSYPAEFQFAERHEGKTRSFRLPGDLIENGHPVYTRLPEEQWRALAPEWAKDRRLEIEEKILRNPFYRPI